MRITRIFFIMISVTVVSLLYVHQQTHIFKLGYMAQKKNELLQDNLDKNAILRYNISKKVSLVSIGPKVCGADKEFQMPDTYRLVKVEYPAGRIQVNQRKLADNLFVRLFGVEKQAEANTINH